MIAGIWSETEYYAEGHTCRVPVGYKTICEKKNSSDNEKCNVLIS